MKGLVRKHNEFIQRELPSFEGGDGESRFLVGIICEMTVRIREWYEIEFDAMYMADHIHALLCCELPKKMAPVQNVQMFKNIAARELFKRKHSVKSES